MRRFLVVAKRVGLGLVALLAVLALIGSIETRVGPDYEPEGVLVPVEGTRLHVDCKGAPGKAPTLVALPGLGANGQCFYWVQRMLVESVRVCRIDPLGKGFSPETEAPRDADTVSRLVLEALHRAGIEPPYVLAGHSLGGSYAHVFAARHRDAVAGLVLLDSTHSEHLQDGSKPGRPGAVLRFAVSMLRVLAVAADMGLVHLYLRAFGGLPDDGLPAEIAATNRSFYRTGKDLRATAVELAATPRVFAAAARANDLGDLPLLVITAGRRAQGRARWMSQQRELAALSSNTRHLIMAEADHDTLLARREHARAVADAIAVLYAALPSAQ